MLAISTHELYFFPILPNRGKIENLFYFKARLNKVLYFISIFS